MLTKPKVVKSVWPLRILLPFTLAPKSPQMPEAKEVVATLALTKQMIVYLADQLELVISRLRGAYRDNHL